MAEQDKVEIGINIKPNTRGLDQTTQKLGIVDRTAKTTLATLRGLSRLNFAIAGIERVVMFFRNLAGNAAESREEIRKLNAEQEKASDAKKIKELSEAYKDLSKNIADAASARKNANEIEDMQRSAERKFEDDSAEADKAAEIAALSPHDPLYAQKKEQIEAKYAGKKAVRSAERAKEDADMGEKRSWEERSAKIQEADEKRWSARADREEAERHRKKARDSAAQSVQENEEDGEGYWDIVKKIVTGQWGKIGDSHTAEGDKLRAEQLEESKRHEAEAERLEAEAKKKEEEAAKADAEAEHLGNKASAYGTISANQTFAVRDAKEAAKRGDAAAYNALAEEEARRASALAASDTLRRQQADVNARIEAEQAKKDAAAQAVWQAQNALDLAHASGGKTETEAKALQEAQAAAAEVNYAADQTLIHLARTLESIETRLKAAQEYLKRSSSATQYAWEDGNAGGLK